MINPNLLWAIGGFLVILTPIVIIHEFGHFWAAKLSKIRVEEFGFGLPPRAIKLFERGGTIYSLNWIPVGGFVRPAGEDDPNVPGGLASASKRARLFVLSAGAGMNFITAILFFWLALVLGAPTVQVGAISPGSPAEIAGLQTGDIVLKAGGAVIVNSGTLNNVVSEHAGTAVDFEILRDGERQTVSVTPRRVGEYNAVTEDPLGVGIPIQISGISPGSPAETGGLRPGDIILEVDGRIVMNSGMLVDIISESGGTSIDLGILRDGQEQQLTVTPRREGEYDPNTEGALGIGLSSLQGPPIRRGPVEAISGSLNFMWEYIALYARLPSMLINGEITAREARPVSIIGISQIAGEAAESSAEGRTLYPILTMASFISIALGLTNLLPLPALDGGRILFVLIEAVRGRRVDPEREGMVHVIGMLVLLALMAVLIIQDIINPILPF